MICDMAEKIRQTSLLDTLSTKRQKEYEVSGPEVFHEDKDMRATDLELEDSTGSHDCDQPQFSSGQDNESEFFFFMLYRQDKSLSTYK